MIYFASDQHFGTPTAESSLEREKAFVRWLESIRADATELYLMGDLFDFWFEYKQVVPRGFVRVLGKLAELRDEGLAISFFTGNHDMWMRDYFEKELAIPVYRSEQIREWNGKRFFLAHGDGLGPGDHGYKFLKKVFTLPLNQWAFRQLHPDFAIRIANYFSRKSRLSQGEEQYTFEGKEKEWLYQFAMKKLQEEYFDYFIFGHRHIPLNIELKKQSKYCNLGDWIKHRTYAKFDGEKLELLHFTD